MTTVVIAIPIGIWQLWRLKPFWSSNPAIVRLCRNYAEDVVAAWRAIEESSLLRTDISQPEQIAVEEELWTKLPREDKVRTANAAFCRIMDASGKGYVRFVGARDGELKAWIRNGYFDSSED
jgi:hypothetical protein